jgi:hypothetical protein
MTEIDLPAFYPLLRHARRVRPMRHGCLSSGRPRRCSVSGSVAIAKVFEQRDIIMRLENYYT